MTDQSEVEKLTREIQHKFTTVVMGDGQEELNTEWEDLARWHIREKAIAVLEAKIQAIDDLKGKTNYSAKDNDEYVVRWSEFDKEIKKLQSRLAEMRNNE